MIDNKLLTLIALSENGSYTKTAENLHLTQPAVSQHIKGLEKELGITIFNRTENGLKPTPQGVIAIRYAKRIQALYELERTRIEDSKKNMFSFTIGITHTSESSLVSNALANYAYSKDGLHITIVTDDISNLYTKLENYEIDLAIIEARNSDPRYRSLLLDTDSIMLADDDARLLFTGDTVYPATLYAHLASGDGMCSDFETYRRTMRRTAEAFADYTLLCSHNEPLRSGSMLTAVADAFDAVAAGDLPYAVDAGGLRKYQFDDFALVTK